MNPMLALALMSVAPGAPVPKEPAPNPLAWSYIGLRLQNSLDGSGNALQIASPEAGTPAYKAGLFLYDELLRVGEIEPRSFEEVQRYIFGLRPGTVITVVVRRGATTKTRQVTLGERPTTPDYQVLPDFLRPATPRSSDE